MKYYFEFGSLHGEEMGKYKPRPQSKSAQFLKLCDVLGGAYRAFFYDSACVSNLTKAGLLKRKGSKLFPTRKGKYYLKTRKVTVDVKEFLLKDSYMRYIRNDIDRVAAALLIGAGTYEGIVGIFNTACSMRSKGNYNPDFVITWVSRKRK